MAKQIFFITGASGAGKTALVAMLKKKYRSRNWAFLNFDSIGVPSQKDMIKQSGSVENWQRDMTFKWIKEILTNYTKKDIIILEGQINLNFIKKGFSQNKFSNYEIVLIDCNEKTMEKRLLRHRKQPELLTKDMRNWLKFLRKQAKDFRATIIDTSNKTKLEVLKSFEQILRKRGLI